MAFDGNFMCTSFKQELLEAVHNFKNSGGNTFNLALYTNSATFTAATTAYTTSNEVADTTWSSATITARGGLIFNDSASGDPTVVVLDFGADKSSTAGDFTVAFPAASSSAAIIRIA